MQGEAGAGPPRRRRGRRWAIGAAGTSTTLGYDPTGRLETQSTTVSGSTTTTTYLYVGDKLIAEYGDGAVLRRYAHGVTEDDPVIWWEGPAMTPADARYLATDRQGTVIGYGDSTGTIPSSAAYLYDPYGSPQTWGGSRFRYTGQIEIPEAQLYYYKARVYDPVAARFLQTDPVGYKDNLDLYAYVGDDPLNKTDPTGNCAEDACVVVITQGAAMRDNAPVPT